MAFNVDAELLDFHPFDSLVWLENVGTDVFHCELLMVVVCWFSLFDGVSVFDEVKVGTEEFHLVLLLVIVCWAVIVCWVVMFDGFNGGTEEVHRDLLVPDCCFTVFDGVNVDEVDQDATTGGTDMLLVIFSNISSAGLLSVD